MLMKLHLKIKRHTLQDNERASEFNCGAQSEHNVEDLLLEKSLMLMVISTYLAPSTARGLLGQCR